jgi:hypothetical protein
MIALHLFNLIFLRFPTTKLGLFATLTFGWSFVGMIVLLGPAALQTPEKGFYFGISGNWCVYDLPVLGLIATETRLFFRPGAGSRMGIQRNRHTWSTFSYVFRVVGRTCHLTHPRQELLSAGTSFFLYVLILLRVRGNLAFTDGRWRLRSLPKGESWQLAMGRDILDTAMLKAAKHMVW